MAEDNQIKSRDRVKNLAEVYTNQKEVDDMLDMIADSASNLNSTFLEPACGNGNFLIKILERKLAIAKTEINILTALSSIYGVDICPENVEDSRKRLLNGVENFTSTSTIELSPDFLFWVQIIINKNILEGNTLEGEITFQRWINLESPEEVPFTSLFEKDAKQLFNVVIGNPPYQINNGGGLGASADPLYDKFIEMGVRLNPDHLIMITPSRWFSGSKPAFKKFRKFMSENNHMKVIVDFPDSRECFPTVCIDGGVNYFLWSKDYSGEVLFITVKEGDETKSSKRPLFEDGLTTVIRDDNHLQLLEKVKGDNFVSLSTIVSSQDPFGFDKRIPGTMKRQKIVFDDELTVLNHTIHLKNKQKKFVSREQITKNEGNLSRYKVFIKKAFKGKIQATLGYPGDVCSETFVAIFVDTELEATNLMEYLVSDFATNLLYLKKISHNTSKVDFALIPVLDFTKKQNDKTILV